MRWRVIIHCLIVLMAEDRVEQAPSPTLQTHHTTLAFKIIGDYQDEKSDQGGKGIRERENGCVLKKYSVPGQDTHSVLY